MDPREIVSGLAKLNPITAIPGLVQQGADIIDPYIQMLVRLLTQRQEPLPPEAVGGNPISGVGMPENDLRQKMSFQQRRR